MPSPGVSGEHDLAVLISATAPQKSLAQRVVVAVDLATPTAVAGGEQMRCE